MFRLVTTRHRRGWGGERPEAALQGRITALQAELAIYKAVARRRARVINALYAGIAGLVLAFALALAANNVPVKRAVTELVQALGLTGAVEDTDAAYSAYQRGNYAIALQLLRPLADQGNARARSIIGLMYQHGRGVPQDYLEAAKWFRLAADQGDASAQFNLGLMYAQGQGLPQDHAEAVKWYRLATDRGYAQAQYNLGLMYAQGQGVSQDFVRAYMWLNLAAARFPASDSRNRSLAIRNRDLVASKMTREQIDEAQNLAREWKPR